MTMLLLDLNRLGREGSVQVEAELPVDAPLWDEGDFPWAGPVGVKLQASNAGSGEIVVRGAIEGVLARECRRCLEPVLVRFEHDLTAVFVESGASDTEDDEGVYVYDSSAELDLSSAVREEILLAVDPYVVCESDCLGLCSICGVNRNTGSCSCSSDEPDPRWEALRALKEK